MSKEPKNALDEIDDEEENYREMLVGLVDIGALHDVNVLIQEGRNVNLPNSNQEYAIIAAARRNETDMVELLLKAGADPRFYNRNGERAMRWAIFYKNKKMIELLEHARTHNPHVALAFDP